MTTRLRCLAGLATESVFGGLAHRHGSIDRREADDWSGARSELQRRRFPVFGAAGLVAGAPAALDPRVAGGFDPRRRLVALGYAQGDRAVDGVRVETALLPSRPRHRHRDGPVLRLYARVSGRPADRDRPVGRL